MPIGFDTHATRRRHLPHLTREGATYFVTYCTTNRIDLPPASRDLAFAAFIAEHGLRYWLHTGTVMPDHVHLLLTPYPEFTLWEILRRIKGGSSYQIARRCKIPAPVWQKESFDHIVRSSESLERKAEYIANNPVRKGLVDRWEDWPWLWRA